MPIVQSTSTVDITWVLDTIDMNGDDVYKYTIYIQTSDPLVWKTEVSISTVKSFSISFATLRVFPYNLKRGDLVKVMVSATNNYGTSDNSTSNTVGATIKTEPS